MRKNIRSIFVISALVALVLCSACVLPSFGEQKKQEGGLTQITVPAASSRIGFEEAYQKLKDYRADSSSVSPEDKRIYYILAKDVDESGNAKSWVFEVDNGNSPKLLIYDKSGWTVFPQSDTVLVSEEILLDQIISARELLTKNKAVIQSSASSEIPDRQDLELYQGVYKLTRYSRSTPSVISFNATSGALIT